MNLLPLLEGDGSVVPRDQFYFYYAGELRGVREGKWKRVYRHRTRSYVGVEPGVDGLPGPYAFPTVEAALYDLETDMGETTDVSAAHPEVVQRLDALAELVRETLGDGLTGRKGTEVRPPGRRGFDRPETVAHLAVGASVTLRTTPSPRYPGEGPPSLTDGRLGSRDHNDERWLGFEGDDLEAVVDLGKTMDVRRIGLDCLQAQISWIFLPGWVEFAVSADGSDWETVRRAPIELEMDPRIGTRTVAADVGAGAVRYIRVRARNLGQNPEWHPGAGGKAWLFVDEIVVEGNVID